MKKRIAITADCVCDLPNDILEEYGIEVIHFYISVDTGCFKDMEEITAVNMVEYFENGGENISTKAPKPQEYEEVFDKVMENAEEIIHFSMTSKLSLSTKFAMEAAEKYNGKIHIFDTEHLSTGMAHMVLKSEELIEEGKNVKEILDYLEIMKKKVSTTFIAENANYLFRAGRVSKFVKDICNMFKIHPVLTLTDGEMKLKNVRIGSYEKSAMRYIRSELKKGNGIDKKRLFITQCSCPLKLINKVEDMVKESCVFEQIIRSNASATVSSNCGPNTFGVLFVRE